MERASEQSRERRPERSATARAVPQMLKDLRSLCVCLFHPRDQDGEALTRQLERIGCQVQTFWPPLPQPPIGTDLVFIALNPDLIHQPFAWCMEMDAPPVIAVVAYENPTIIDAVLRIGAKAIVASPVRSFGLLSALVLARELSNDFKQQRKHIARLESKLNGMRRLGEAQDILCRQHAIGRDEAYRLIREQAMKKRVSIEDMAGAMVEANEILACKI